VVITQSSSSLQKSSLGVGLQGLATVAQEKRQRRPSAVKTRVPSTVTVPARIKRFCGFSFFMLHSMGQPAHRLPNALPFSCKGRYVMIDSTTARAGPLVIDRELTGPCQLQRLGSAAPCFMPSSRPTVLALLKSAAHCS
jgi:hypothetical protein